MVILMQLCKQLAIAPIDLICKASALFLISSCQDEFLLYIFVHTPVRVDETPEVVVASITRAAPFVYSFSIPLSFSHVMHVEISDEIQRKTCVEQDARINTGVFQFLIEVEIVIHTNSGSHVSLQPSSSIVVPCPAVRSSNVKFEVPRPSIPCSRVQAYEVIRLRVAFHPVRPAEFFREMSSIRQLEFLSELNDTRALHFTRPPGKYLQQNFVETSGCVISKNSLKYLSNK
mmetsp:Transcript_26068/g.36416  ORF Transcript_26068/g.36416 Transcript_26068/m.36416 type:complete len:231 (-) Transcript_26068:138-830(-)